MNEDSLALTIHDRGDDYDILDGHLRYEILREFGETTIPCLVLKEVQNHE
jgi:ParB-like chromosome segregation protein Spo0J